MKIDNTPANASEYPYKSKQTMLSSAERYFDLGFKVEIMPKDYMFPCYVIRVYNKGEQA